MSLKSCQEDVSYNQYFLLDFPSYLEIFTFVSYLPQRNLMFDVADDPANISFLNNLDSANKTLFLPGGRLLPFYNKCPL